MCSFYGQDFYVTLQPWLYYTLSTLYYIFSLEYKYNLNVICGLILAIEYSNITGE